MNGIAGYLPILILNFNLYGIVCTVPTPRCKGLLFVEGICQTIQHNKLLDVHETLQTWNNYLQGSDGKLHQFLKCIQTKKTLQFTVLDLFGDISGEICIKQKLHNTSCPSCCEIKSLPKNTFLKKNYNVDIRQ